MVSSPSASNRVLHWEREVSLPFWTSFQFFFYPDFETDPHSALMRSIKLNLRTREIESTDYAASPNPPILPARRPSSGPTTP